MFEYFTEKAIATVMAAQEEARRLKQNYVGTEQLLLGLLRVDGTIAAHVLSEAGLTLSAARIEVEKIIGRGTGGLTAELPFTPKTKRVFEEAFQQAHQLDSRHIAPEHLLLSLIEDGEGVAVKILNNLDIDPGIIRSAVIRAIGEEPIAAGSSAGRGTMRSSGRQPNRNGALAEFGRNLTELAAKGELDQVVGRAKELERVIQILGRRTKNNPVLIGEPGVGKTAIAEGLAQRIVNQDVPSTLLDKQVISLDMGAVLSGTRFRGDFEERMKQIMEEVTQSDDIILMIDEIHTLVGAGSVEGGMDAANLLKPALARGSFQCIGATTLDEYRKHIERDAALERRFQPVTVNEPSVEDTLAILRGLRSSYEQHHRLIITDAALEAAATLSDRYIPDRFMPDKAIDLIDEAGSLVRFRHAKKSPAKELERKLRQTTQEKQAAVREQDFDKAGKLRDRELELEAQLKQTQTEFAAVAQPEVTAEDIAQVTASWTGIPVNQLTESESVMLMHLEDMLHERVIGQNEAVTAVSRAIRRARVGLKNPDRPIASLVFSGPTGVGKTELAKALAASVFGSEEAMIRVDMSEYMESHTVSKLIGSPPGYVGYDEGGQLTELVRRKPYTVILLDEIEKAHPDVFNMLLQILEDGRLTDAKGRVVSFKNTLLVMTSNIGSRVIEKGGGGLGFDFSTDDMEMAKYGRIRSLVNEELKQHFRPELLNRIDEIIVFRQLTRPEVVQIADLMLKEVSARLEEQEISLDVTDACKERLITEGFDPSYGARPLRRAIARFIEDNLAEAMLAGTVKAGDTAVLDIDDDGQVQVRSQQEPVLVGVSS
ncbi:ATP-dependent Clp protease ATP-binding subunit [Oculatella sp. LEGE 06141]|uniref:ATP-dependent Clp protease ATP-binding subunit n=1 Tax=Oculatella sp. LEGE 06141 TaxID=1828648 RepID=UPI00187F7AAA|nr:ATP-dependent Clp protease ATP-binding subunit [Oculatella sp. LEGE 06141]MBE9176974.1 ATP-dependent Clp protease ATP-binding subunit [Oculatella sp. LEGE 06141]